MYFPRNWEFGSALSKLRNFGGGGWTPPPPNPPRERHCYTFKGLPWPTPPPVPECLQWLYLYEMMRSWPHVMRMEALRRSNKELSHLSTDVKVGPEHGPTFRAFVSVSCFSCFCKCCMSTKRLWHWHCSLTFQIWHSEDRASWYILIIKANKMHYFSNLFR